HSVHKTSKVPHIALIFTALIILILTWFGSFEFVLAAAAFTILLYYSITNIAALKQEKPDRLYPQWIPVLGFMGCLAMAVSLNKFVVFSGVALLLIGWVFRWVLHRFLKPSNPQN